MTTRLKPYAPWLLAVALALLFIGFLDHIRIQRVTRVSAINAENLKIDGSTLTGYAANTRWLIVPEHDNATYQWLQETEVMAKAGDWRLHHITYENAPKGRDVHSASIFRWLILATAEVGHYVSNDPLAVAIEHSALYISTVLHVLLIIGAVGFCWRAFGPASAGVTGIFLATLFPLTSHFVPGIANDYGLIQICTFFQALFLFSGLTQETRSRPCFIAAGIAGGFGLWISATNEVPVLGALGIGAILMAFLRDKSAKGQARIAPLPWRDWALSGALTSFVGYLVEYFPHHLDVRLQVNSPLYALGWIGLGEVAHQLATGFSEQKMSVSRIAKTTIGVLLLAAVPIAIVVYQSGLARELLAQRLSDFPSTPLAENIAILLSRPGAGLALLASFSVLSLLGIPCWMLFRRSTPLACRRIALVGLVATAFLLVVSFFQLRWWSTIDILAIALVAAVLPSALQIKPHGIVVRVFLAICGVAVFFGTVESIASLNLGHPDQLTTAEVEGLRERDLAHWLAAHSTSSTPTVLLPPYRTPSFCFYAPLRGIGSQNWENSEGAGAAFHLAASPREDETQALLLEHGVTEIVLPSWDTDLIDVISATSPQPEKTFIYQLKHWSVLNWLRPRANPASPIPGVEDAAATIFSVVDETDRATAISRYTEYFLETQQPGLAVQGVKALRNYPASLSALTTIAEVEKAEADQDGFDKDLHTIVETLKADPDQEVAFDQRVSLAVVLLLGEQRELAKEQTSRCLKDATPERIRFLGTEALYHLMVLGKTFDQSFPDPKLGQLALDLLPPNLKERL